MWHKVFAKHPLKLFLKTLIFHQTQEEMEQESRKFEDAEFQALEMMSKLDEEKEELQRSLIRKKRRLELQVEARKVRIILFFVVKITVKHFKKRFITFVDLYLLKAITFLF